MTHDTNNSGRIDIDDLEWHYLEGDGDFRSKEVCKLRDEADIIVTNPPFSLFREFIAWVLSAQKGLLAIGNINAITYKEIFPSIKDNLLWLGATAFMSDMVFGVPKGAEIDPKDKAKAERLGYVGDYTRLGNSCWFTNLDHGRRHEPLNLMTMKENIRFGKHKTLSEKGYLYYDNYDAMDVPYTDAIPKDYNDVMGVPITFLDKYCPEQFEIVTLGIGESFLKPTKFYKYFADPITGKPNKEKRDYHLWIRDEEGRYLTNLGYRVNGVYSRIMIRKKQ